MESTKKTVKDNKVMKLEETMLINVKSNTFGKLVYVNHRTGEKTVWSNAGDTQTMALSDLRAMKASQSAFFTNKRISIESTEEEDVKPTDIYKALAVSQYYANMVDPTDFNKINSWTVAQIPEKIAQLTESEKLNLVTALNEYIEEGKLDSVKKIKAFEEALNCELAQSK